MTVLLYFVSFASLFALFASVSAGTFWLLTKFLRALMAPRAAPNVAAMPPSVSTRII